MKQDLLLLMALGVTTGSKLRQKVPHYARTSPQDNDLIQSKQTGSSHGEFLGTKYLYSVPGGVVVADTYMGGQYPYGDSSVSSYGSYGGGYDSGSSYGSYGGGYNSGSSYGSYGGGYHSGSSYGSYGGGYNPTSSYGTYGGGYNSGSSYGSYGGGYNSGSTYGSYGGAYSPSSSYGSYGSSYSPSSSYGTYGGSYDDGNCYGSYGGSHLANCSWSHNCQYKTVGDFRLVVDSCSDSEVSGRLEYNHNGEWGTVCDDDFDRNNNAAQVACKQLGLPYTGAVRTNARGSGSIWLDNVYCYGTEASILDCSHNAIGSHNCNHSEDVGLRCRN